MENPKRVGRYDILERIGRGAMGELYRGRDSLLGREVAIKVMSADFLGEEDAKPRFYREARAVAKLQHRNIVAMFEFGEDGETPFIVMEFLRGTSLAARIRTDPPLTIRDKLDIIEQLCTGLHYAHERGIVHRDIKPANIWISEDGTVKLLDFGIAKVGSSTFTHHGDVLGSAAYMSPEQVTGGKLDGRSDIFASGVVLYELLTGRKPFDADSVTGVLMKVVREVPTPIRSIDPDVPEPVAQTVERALQKEPARRFAHAGEFGSTLKLCRLSLPSMDGTSEQSTASLHLDDLIQDEDAGSEPARFNTLDDTAEPPTSPGVLPPRTRGPNVSRLTMAVAAALLVCLAVATALAFRSRAGNSPPLQDATARLGAPSAPPADPGPSGTPAVVPPTAPASATTSTPGSAGPSATPPPGAPGARATLTISLVPRGATVEVDDRAIGAVTPTEIQIGETRPQRIRLALSGYQTLTSTVTEENLRHGLVEYRLAANRQPMVVVISGAYAFDVLEGRRVVSESARTHTVTVAAPATLRIRAADYLLDQPISVVPASGGRAEFTAPQLGRLNVRTNFETCVISIAGDDFGFPPLVNRQLAAGSYVVELRCPDGQRRTAPAVVVGGQATSVSIR